VEESLRCSVRPMAKTLRSVLQQGSFSIGCCHVEGGVPWNDFNIKMMHQNIIQPKCDMWQSTLNYELGDWNNGIGHKWETYLVN